MPAGKGCKKEKGQECEDDGNDARNCQPRSIDEELMPTYIRYGKTMASLNVCATQTRFRGS